MFTRIPCGNALTAVSDDTRTLTHPYRHNIETSNQKRTCMLVLRENYLTDTD